MSAPPLRPVVPEDLARGAARDQDVAAAEARDRFALMAAAIGVADLSSLDVLDVGGGTAPSQALLTHDVAVGSYTCSDGDPALIDWLDAAVDDQRCAYSRLDEGPPLDLGVRDRRFDLIEAWTLFTHVEPERFEAMLRTLRPLIRPDGHLFLVAFLNEVTDGGHGLVDTWMRHLPREAKEDFARRVDDAGIDDPAEAPDFVDFTPARPLLHALYSRAWATELIERSGWRVAAITDPVPLFQHQLVCRPA